MKTAIINHPDCVKHNMGPGHPEQPARVQAIQNALETSAIADRLQFIEAPLIDRETLALAHDKNYIEEMFAASPESGLHWIDPDTAMNQHTLQAALRAAGAAVHAVDLVAQGDIEAVFCNVRPPGHHAEHNRAMGFCFFNNIAIAAKYALKTEQFKRVAIVDFDVHHGNGTEDIIADDERILLCSTFQHPFYPYSGTETTSDHIKNIPLTAFTDSKSYRQIIAEQWLNLIQQFKPDLILVSAGFDGHRDDPLGQLLLTENDYAWIIKQLKLIAPGKRIVATLEGGYNLEAIAASAVAVVRELVAD
jgi:acetoin utilization deacetylase AcuC-like enzyme